MILSLIEILTLGILVYPIGKGFLKLNSNGSRSGLLESGITGFFLLSTGLYLLAFFFPITPLALIPLLMAAAIFYLIKKGTGTLSWKVPIATIWPALVLASALASLPLMLPDDSIYHYQTILGLSSQGWIKGIANIEPRFALGSSVHVFSAATSFMGQPLPLNAFFFSLMIIKVTQSFGKSESRIGWFWLLIILLGFPLYLLMITSTSPDILGLVITAALIENEFLRKNPHRLFTAVLLGSAILLKPNIAYSTAVIAVVALFLQPLNRRDWRAIIVISVITILALVAKNIITSGYPLFPLPLLPLALPWSVPDAALRGALETLKAGQLEGSPPINGIMTYLSYILLGAGIKSAFNWLALGIITGLLIMLLRRKTFVLYQGLGLSMLLIVPQWLMMNTSPNFRLGMHFLIPLLSVLIISLLLSRLSKISTFKTLRGIQLGVIAVCLALFALPDIDLSRYVQNEYYSRIYTLKIDNLIYPVKLERTIIERKRPFPSVSYDLFPDYETRYDEKRKVYYLQAKN